MSNGNQDGPPVRRLRFDDLSSTLVHSQASSSLPRHSGRKLVLVACATILVLWAMLYLVFRDWRSRYLARVNFGATQVAPIIESLADHVPPGIDPRSWKDAVGETHSMLVTVTGSNLLDLPQMEALRGELKQVVTRAKDCPEQALYELASVWDSMNDRAGFVLKDGGSGRYKGHPRPAILPPRAVPAKRPVTKTLAPPQSPSLSTSPSSVLALV
jgi:hypothetical protein